MLAKRPKPQNSPETVVFRRQSVKMDCAGHPEKKPEVTACTSLPVSFQRANACVRGEKRIPVLACAQKFLGISGNRPSRVKGHRFLTHRRLKTLVFRRIFCSPNRRCLPVEQRRVNPQRGISRERFAGKRPCRRKLAWQTCQNWRNSAASLPKTCTWSA